MASGARQWTSSSQSLPQSIITRLPRLDTSVDVCRRCRLVRTSISPRVPRNVSVMRPPTSIGTCLARSVIDEQQEPRPQEPTTDGLDHIQGEAMVNVLERGNIYFVYRLKVEHTSAAGLE